MADAWTTLTNNSSLGSGDAWEHLNSQQGGIGGKYISDKALTFRYKPKTILFNVDKVEEFRFEYIDRQEA